MTQYTSPYQLAKEILVDLELRRDGYTNIRPEIISAIVEAHQRAGIRSVEYAVEVAERIHNESYPRRGGG